MSIVVEVPEQQQEVHGRSLFQRLLIGLCAIVVVLGVINLIVVGLRSLDKPGTPLPRQLLYASSFDSFNEEWSQFDGQMSSKIVDGQLVIAINASRDGAYSVLDHDFSDFDVQAAVKRLATDDEYNEIGLLFRYRDPDNFYIF